MSMVLVLKRRKHHEVSRGGFRGGTEFDERGMVYDGATGNGVILTTMAEDWIKIESPCRTP